MRKTINIAGKDVELKATASTIRKYRNWFNRDLIHDFKALQTSFSSGAEVTTEMIEVIQNLTYVMARQADPTISGNIDDWLDSFEDGFPIQNFAVDVVTLWAESLQVKVESKNA